MSAYLGMFLTAFSILAIEITIARLLSVVTWYHLAFFSISAAMLGMTAGAVRVYLDPKRFEADRLHAEASRTCIVYALVIPVALVLLCLLPLDLRPSAMSYLAFLVATVACALPFFHAGVVVTAVLTKSGLPIGRLYASDLLGAALGCLFVLGGLEVFDAPSLILLCSAVAVLASMAFAGPGSPKPVVARRLLLLAFFVVLPFVNSFSVYGIRPSFVKGRIERVETFAVERWNSFSRVVMYKGGVYPPSYWGPSPLAPTNAIQQFMMNIDGEAGTTMQRFRDLDDIAHLKYDVTTVAYNLDRGGAACVIGAGGGRDVQSALLFGHDRVVGIDVNPVFIGLLKGEFRDFANIAGRNDVVLVVDDARSWLSHTPEKFTVLQMSLIDTWAATGAGAFSLTENALYTVEAWKVFLGRLTEDGVFTVSRWHNPGNIGETGRVIALAMQTLMEMGAREPARHIALITTGRISTLIVGARPLSDDDVAKLRRACATYRYEPAYLPGDTPENGILCGLLAARTTAELRAVVADATLNLEPPTDENPYFFNMLRLSNLGVAAKTSTGVIHGNLTATITLLVLLACLLVLAVLTIVVPLALRPKEMKGSGLLWAGALYFSLIGCAFMFLEIALIQKLSVFLGHPVYALGILLFTIILSSGVGSFISDRLPLSRKPWAYVYPLATVAAILGARLVLKAVLAGMITSPIHLKILAAIGVVSPMGLLMGFFFPVGMRLVRQAALASNTPWYWALNGIFGVLCSALAVFFSIYISVSANFFVAIGCYGATLVCIAALQSKAGTAAA